MKNFNLTVCAAAFALVGACAPSAEDATGQPAAAPASPTEGKSMNLLAKLELTSGNVVEFYESAPGHVFMSEQFPQSGQPVVNRALAKLSPGQAYRTLAPGAELPLGLVQAEQRIAALAAQGAAGKGATATKAGEGGAGAPDLAHKGQGSDGPIVPQGAYSPTYFMSWAPGCPNHYDQNHYNWCKTDVGGSWMYFANGADADYAVVCSDVGSATFQVTQDGSTSTINVATGACRSYQSFVSDDPFDLFDFDIKFRAWANSGSSLFHFAGYLEW